MTRNPSYFYIFLTVNLVSFICLEKWNLIGLRLTFLITIVYCRTIGIYSVFARILSNMRPNNYACIRTALNCIENFLVHLPDIQRGPAASACSVISSCAADESEVFRNVGRRPGCCCFCHFLAALRQWSWCRRAAIVPAAPYPRVAEHSYCSVRILSRVCVQEVSYRSHNTRRNAEKWATILLYDLQSSQPKL